MAQKTSGQRTAEKPKKEYPTAGNVLREIAVPAVRPATSADGTGSHELQDDHLWDAAVENSIDAIRELAEKALADRQAGRTKKITI